MLTADLTGRLNGFGAGPRVADRVPADWTDEPITRFSLTPISRLIGAVVEGVDLREPVDDELFAQLDRALLEWKVLFFRGQELTHDQHAAFARRWGPLENHPFYGRTTGIEAEPDVVRLEKDETTSGYENVWHSDVTWRMEPSLGSVLRAIEVPEMGGDTMWCDMAAAYDGLTEGMKERLAGLTAVHDWWWSFGQRMDPAKADALRGDFPPAEHPVVRTHPATGRKTLYVNRAFTQHIVGLDDAESAELLDHLYARAMIPEYQCRWRWQPGDVAFWDNRSTQHYAVSDYFPQRRVMERITIVGDKPFS